MNSAQSVRLNNHRCSANNSRIFHIIAEHNNSPSRKRFKTSALALKRDGIFILLLLLVVVALVLSIVVIAHVAIGLSLPNSITSAHIQRVLEILSSSSTLAVKSCTRIGVVTTRARRCFDRRSPASPRHRGAYRTHGGRSRRTVLSYDVPRETFDGRTRV